MIVSSHNSWAPRPMTVIFGLGTRLRVRMRTTLENGVLQTTSAVKIIIDQSEFVALSSRRAPRCGKHQFRDKVTVSTWTVSERLFDYCSVWSRSRARFSEVHALASYSAKIAMKFHSAIAML